MALSNYKQFRQIAQAVSNNSEEINQFQCDCPDDEKQSLSNGLKRVFSGQTAINDSHLTRINSNSQGIAVNAQQISVHTDRIILHSKKITALFAVIGLIIMFAGSQYDGCLKAIFIFIGASIFGVAMFDLKG